jgi:hypothetical protein
MDFLDIPPPQDARQRQPAAQRSLPPDPDAVDPPEPSPPGAETPAEVAWRAAKAELKKGLDRHDFLTWVEPLVPVPGERIELWCPTPRIALTVQESFGAALQAAVGAEVRLIHG